MARCVVDSTVIMEAVGSSETLVFMYKTIHVTYPKNVVLTPAVSSSTDFPVSVQVAFFYYQVIECVEGHLHTLLCAIMAWYLGTKLN
jgi:hypothetical protein